MTQMPPITTEAKALNLLRRALREHDRILAARTHGLTLPKDVDKWERNMQSIKEQASELGCYPKKNGFLR